MRLSFDTSVAILFHTIHSLAGGYREIMVAEGVPDEVTLERDGMFEPDILRRGTYLDGILAWRDVPHPFMLARVITELLRVEFQLHGLRLTGFEGHADKAL